MRSLAAVLIASLCGLAATARADWPDFRGPWCDGRANPPGSTNSLGLPLHWSETENIKWKTPIHDRGWSTPVIMNGQVWLTTATIDGHDFFAVCVDEATGKIRFDNKIFHCDNPESLGAAVNFNCYASPSAVLEPGRAYVHFGTYGTACLDASTGKTIWKRDDLPCRHFRGPGSSPILCDNLLILTMDGIDQQYVVALDKNTGKTVWKTDRTAQYNDLDNKGRPTGGGDFRKAFSTPLVIDAGGVKQIITTASKAAYSYNAATGSEIWKLAHGGYSPASRPLFDDGRVIVTSGNGKPEIMGLRPDVHGDVPPEAVLWRVARGSPSRTSGTIDNGLLYIVNEGGIACCFQTADGTEVWRERIGGEYSASILYGDGKIYAFSQDGKSVVLQAGRTFGSLATNQLSAGFMASPAADGHALYLRTMAALYRVEDGSAKPGTKL